MPRRATRRTNGLATIRKYFLRPWVVMPLVAIVALGAWWIWFRPDDGADSAAADTEQVVEVTTGTMAQTVSAEGTIAAAQTDDLSFTSAGTVTAVNVKAGQAVKTGDVLATIDSAELAAAVADAEASVADAKRSSRTTRMQMLRTRRSTPTSPRSRPRRTSSTRRATTSLVRSSSRRSTGRSRPSTSPSASSSRATAPGAPIRRAVAADPARPTTTSAVGTAASHPTRRTRAAAAPPRRSRS